MYMMLSRLLILTSYGMQKTVSGDKKGHSLNLSWFLWRLFHRPWVVECVYHVNTKLKQSNKFACCQNGLVWLCNWNFFLIDISHIKYFFFCWTGSCLNPFYLFLDPLFWLYFQTFNFCRIFSHLFPSFKNDVSRIICYLFSSAAPSLPTLPMWDIWPYSLGCSLQCIRSAATVCHQDEFEGVKVLPQTAKKAFHHSKWRKQVYLLF